VGHVGRQLRVIDQDRWTCKEQDSQLQRGARAIQTSSSQAEVV
jgi:hypothetical protein